ncbi:MAG: AsmA-like C-terminal region-containing protein [Chitinophagales bacterium]
MKKILITIGVFFILLIGGTAIVPFLFKDKIVQAAKDAANQELNAVLNFESIDVSLLQNIKHFPDITLIVHNPSIAGIGQFTGDTLVKMEALKLALDIKSLFQTEQPMKINSVELLNADIYAKVAADSQTNWDIAKPSKDTKEPSKFSLAIENIVLDNVYVKYIDVPANNSAEIIGLNHKANGDFTNNLVKYSSETTIDDVSYFQGLIPYLKNARLTNESTIEIDQAAKKYSFSANKIQLNDLELLLNGFIQQMDKEAMSMRLDFKTENNDFKKVLSLIPSIYKNDFKNIETKGQFDLKGNVEGLYRGSVYPKMDIVFNVNNGEFQYPNMPKKVSNIQIVSAIKSPGGSMDNMTVDVSKFSMNIGSDPFEGRLKVTQPMSNPYTELYSKGKINLGDVLKFYPMEGVKKLEGMVNLDLDLKARQSDLKAKNYAAIHADGNAIVKGLIYESSTIEKPVRINDLALNFSPQFVDMPACIGNIGATDCNIKGRLENFRGYYLSKDEVMSGNISMACQKVDMNEFASEEKNGKKSDYVMVPNKIDLTGNATIGEMLYGKMIIKNIAGSMAVKEEKINLSNVKAELLGGSAKMNAIYSTVGQTKPITAVHYDIESFDINQVYNYMESASKLAPIMKFMTGKLSSKSNLTMNLLPDMSPDLSTLNGDFTVAIPLAKVVGLPVLQQIASVTKLSQLNSLEATNINADLAFDKGRVVLKPTNFKANNLDMTLAGFQGLDKSLDYKMAVDVPFSQLGNASSVVSGLVSKFNLPFLGNINPETIRLNLNVKGFFDKPQISLGAPDILSGGKPTTTSGVALDAAKKAGEDLKNQATKTVDSVKSAAVQEANKKVEEEKQKAEEEVEKKKNELLDELKKKLPW